MRWMWNKKDGGPESHVWMYGLEIKWLFSVLVLRFENGSREAYHSHAFNCVSWVLRGLLLERLLTSGWMEHPKYLRIPVVYGASRRPVWTYRDTFHKVTSLGRTWVLTFRGPWASTWQEHVDGRYVTLAAGRREVSAP